MLELIFLYRASKCTQIKEQGEDCLWIHIIFLCYYCQFIFLSRGKQNRIKLCYNRLQFVKETQISTTQNLERRAKPRRSVSFLNILLGATCTTTWGQTFKYYIELASWLVHVLCDFKTNMTSISFSQPWIHHQKYILLYFIFYVKVLPPSFHYGLGIVLPIL